MSVPAIKFPQSALIDQKTGRISREWQQWLLNPQFMSINLGAVLDAASGGTGTGTIPANGQLLIGNGSGYSVSSLNVSGGLQLTAGVGTLSLTINGIDAAQVISGIFNPLLMPAFSGDASSSAGTTALTLATVNTSPGSYGSASKTVTATVNDKGLVTALSEQAISIPSGQVTGLGTMAAQNANSVAIAGGTLNNVTLGGTIPGVITGTTITATGAFGCNGKTAQTSSAVNTAITATAGAIYTATEQTMLNDIKNLLNQIRTALINNGIAV